MHGAIHRSASHRSSVLGNLSIFPSWPQMENSMLVAPSGAMWEYRSSALSWCRLRMDICIRFMLPTSTELSQLLTPPELTSWTSRLHSTTPHYWAWLCQELHRTSMPHTQGNTRTTLSEWLCTMPNLPSSMMSTSSFEVLPSPRVVLYCLMCHKNTNGMPLTWLVPEKHAVSPEVTSQRRKFIKIPNKRIILLLANQQCALWLPSLVTMDGPWIIWK